jgi:hypothetical protein
MTQSFREFEDINTGVAHTPVINTTFIEAVAKSMGFQTTDDEYRSSLHSVPMVYHARMKVYSVANGQTDGANATVCLSHWAYVCNTERMLYHCGILSC